DEWREYPVAETVVFGIRVRDVAADLEPLAEQKRLALDVTVAEPIPAVLAPTFLLQEAVSNLVSNAIKYTPEGGTVRIWARVPERNTGSHDVVIGVSDTGIGLSRDDLGR